MSISAHTRFGPYEILSVLGAGGMGEVYKAHDTRLDRSVAIKVLPSAFVRDADRLARFEREAKAVAALSHPNVLAIFDTGVQDTHAYLVMELLDGETLADRLLAGPLPVRKAVEIAVQIARGLAAAHAKGIVHRDLKPSNVFVLQDGQVKILDFGLAKSMSTDGDTTAAVATDPGAVLGTAGYMAPEQVRGQATDARTDLFALGAVLYEMLTGQRAFKRDTAAETLTAILNNDPPDLAGSRPDLSPALERIVRHCLEKNPSERFQSARDVAFALEAFSGSSTSGAAVAGDQVPTRASTSRRWLLGAVAVAVIGTALGAGVLAGRRMSGAPPSSPTFTTKTFERQMLFNARFMPDGQTIVYSAATQGLVPDVYVLHADAVEAQRIAAGSTLLSVSRTGELALQTTGGTTTASGAVGATFGTLARMSAGGAPRAVLEQVGAADWGPDGDSLAVIHAVGGKYRLEYPIGTTLYETTGALGNGYGNIRVSPDGTRVAFIDQPVQGAPQSSVKIVDRSRHVTTLTGEFTNGAGGLAWTPDGTTVIFTALEGANTTWPQMHTVVALAASPVRVLLPSPGGLVAADVAPNGSLLAVRHDGRTGMMAMLPHASTERDVSWLNFSSSAIPSKDGGSILFQDLDMSGHHGSVNVLLRRTDGAPAQRLGEGAPMDLSPDAKWALAFLPGSPPRVVLYPTGPGTPVMLPSGPIERHVPVGAWFPDGQRVLVCGNEASHAPRCYAQDVAGGAPKPVTPDGVVGKALSSDGRRLLAQGPDGTWQIVPFDGGPVAAHGLRPDDLVAGWSMDGQSAFVTGAYVVPAHLERVNLLTGVRTLIKELAPLDRGGLQAISEPFVRDDGREYAYTYSRVFSTLYQIDGLNLSGQ